MTRALSSLDGVQAVDVDLASREVKVQFDASKVSVDALKNAIAEAGYDVSN